MDSDSILTLGSGVDELTSVESFDGNEILSSVLILVRVSEHNLGEGSSTAGVVHDFLHNSLDVTKQSITLTVSILTLLSRRNQEF